MNPKLAIRNNSSNSIHKYDDSDGGGDNYVDPNKDDDDNNWVIG